MDGLRGLIEAGSSGLIIPPDDPDALETGHDRLLDHPEEARRLGRNARERIQTDFDPDVEADRLVELYQRSSIRHDPEKSDAGTRLLVDQRPAIRAGALARSESPTLESDSCDSEGASARRGSPRQVALECIIPKNRPLRSPGPAVS